jgi:hypothetical protein
MTPDVESARAEWETSHRRLSEAARDPGHANALYRQLEVVTEELRKRVGSTFTVGELAAEYWRAEAWTREAVAQRAPSASWPADLAVVEGAAFHLYARGAVDYVP